MVIPEDAQHLPGIHVTPPKTSPGADRAALIPRAINTRLDAAIYVTRSSRGIINSRYHLLQFGNCR